MWQKISLTAGVMLTLVLLCSNSGFAQVRYSPEHREWEVYGFVGRGSGDNLQFPTAVSGTGQETLRTVGMDYDSGYVFGLRINQNLGDFWGADLEYSFANQPVRFTNLSPGIQSLSLSHYLHHLSYNVSFLPLPLTKRFRPYAGAGIGGALFYIPGHAKHEALEHGVALRDSWEFLFNSGGGFKYLVMDSFALSFDVKNRLSRVPSYGLPPSARVVDGQYQPGMARHGVTYTWQASVSLSFQWND
jgi:opacity protein-like surface antigen